MSPPDNAPSSCVWRTMKIPLASPESVTPGATLIYMTTDRGECRATVRSVTPECLTVDGVGGVERVKWFDVLDFVAADIPSEASKATPVSAEIHVITQSPEQSVPPAPSAQDQERSQATIDAMLIGAGFDPGIEYIRQRYGEHWHKRLAAEVHPPAAAPDLTPLVDQFRQAVSEISAVHQAQIDSLAKAVSVLAEKNTSTAEIQSSLIAALNEARKPVDINLKIEMPEQRTKRFVAERDGEGRMTLSEISQDSHKQH